ncbi:MAG: hypothetical protein BZY73_06455 [SAR202 cluster bacterium Casp-Chloro-G3]|nr:MAG: hypothetical protein BZY73_06455 [SAR202 cluster bacterium Casp-Chloro-G3]
MISENDRTPQNSAQAADQTNTCCHHWIIDSAEGPVSAGSCQNCGEVKEFKNSIDYEAEWTNRRDVARSKVYAPADGLEEATKIAG